MSSPHPRSCHPKQLYYMSRGQLAFRSPYQIENPFNRPKLNDILKGRAAWALHPAALSNVPLRGRQYVSNLEGFFRRSILYSHGYLRVVGHACQGFFFFPSYPLRPAETSYILRCQLVSNFTSLHHSVYCSRWRRVVWKKTDYQQWTMKPVLFNRLKIFR